MRIAIDGMGGDHAPDEIVAGTVEAAKLLPEAKLLLVGQKERLSRPDMPSNVQIIHASEVVGMDEEPLRAMLGKPDSSLRRSLSLVKHGEADAVISAGNTGALVGGAIFPLKGLGNLEGVKRPAIAVPIPHAHGSGVLLDAGANPAAKPFHLVQYAVMGAVYARFLRPEIGLPRLGLLNIGEEARKGTELIKQTYEMLEKSDLNFEFIGNIEPHKMFDDNVHVVVCDGFVGNLVLKMAEGVKTFILEQFSNASASSAEIQQAVRKAGGKFDYSEYGGAPVLGVRGMVIKAHGRSQARAITNAIKMTAGAIKDRLNDHIVAELHKITGSSWFSKWFHWSKEAE